MAVAITNGDAYAPPQSPTLPSLDKLCIWHPVAAFGLSRTI
jgi:hypothetical protein